MTIRRWTQPALLGAIVLSLSACTTAGVFGDAYPGQSRAPRTNRPVVYDRPAQNPPNRRVTADYHRLEQDAARYANLLDRELRLNNRQERAIRDLLVQRGQRFVSRSNRHNQRSAYPFPRDARLSSNTRQWWNATDRQIERVLNGNQRREYRSMTRDLDRYGRYDRARDRRDDRRDDRYDRDDDDDRDERRDNRRNRRGRDR